MEKRQFSQLHTHFENKNYSKTNTQYMFWKANNGTGAKTDIAFRRFIWKSMCSFNIFLFVKHLHLFENELYRTLCVFPYKWILHSGLQQQHRYPNCRHSPPEIMELFEFGTMKEKADSIFEIHTWYSNTTGTLASTTSLKHDCILSSTSNVRSVPKATFVHRIIVDKL